MMILILVFLGSLVLVYMVSLSVAYPFSRKTARDLGLPLPPYLLGWWRMLTLRYFGDGEWLWTKR